MNGLLLFAVTISWSVFHPTWPDADQFKRIVAKADEYGGIDSFEACGRCGSPNGGLNGSSLREYFRCACAYFDDMGANAAEAPRLASAVAAAEKSISGRMADPSFDGANYTEHCSAAGENLDFAYHYSLRWLCREFLREYKAEYAARQKFLRRKDVVDFVVPGGIYDDVRCWRTAMHSSYQDVNSGVPVRYAGNAIFPNGAVMVELKAFPNAVLEIDIDTERGAITLGPVVSP